MTRRIAFLSVMAALVCQVTYAQIGYQDTVIGLSPTYYYQLNEPDASAGVTDTMGNGPVGDYNGDYEGGGPEAGIPGPDFLIEGGQWTDAADEWDEVGAMLPLVGLGDGNLAHASNNAGHITLGDGADFASNAISLSMFARGGPANGGDRLFTNNVTDPLTSFQVVVGNDGIVVSTNPTVNCPDVDECGHRSLFFPDQGVELSNQGADRGLNGSANGWWHIVATTEGDSAEERTENIRLFLNGVDRTDDMLPGTTGWGTDTGLAKIGGRRANATDSTTHSGAQDEVAIWLDRALTDQEAISLYSAAVTTPVRQYTTQKSTNAPTIDGVIEAGEWDGVARTGDFVLLREPEGTAEDANWQVASKWDDENLYLLMTTDYDGWREGGNADNEGEDCTGRLNCDMDFGLDNINLYIDPNNGDLGNTEATNGYQIAFNLNEGNSFYRDGEATRTGVFQEAHVNSGFGNQGGWGTGENEGNLLWAFESNTGADGGVVEIVIPWDALDAPGPNEEGAVLVDGAPEVGDEWYMNFGIISGDPGNFLPIWNWNSSQSFVTRPDGVFTFVADVPCDVNMDGVCDTADIDAMTQKVIDGEATQADRTALIESPSPQGLNTYIGDSDFNGQFDEQDFVAAFIGGKYITGEQATWAQGDWDGNFLFDEQDFVAAFVDGGYLQGPRASVAAVPEPSSLVLLALGMLAFIRRRR